MNCGFKPQFSSWYGFLFIDVFIYLEDISVAYHLDHPGVEADHLK